MGLLFVEFFISFYASFLGFILFDAPKETPTNVSMGWYAV
jgi:hypothetical protein